MVRTRLLAPVRPRDDRAVFFLALLAYVLFSLFDWLTTVFSLDAGGVEGNPIAASVFSMFGNPGLLTFKALVVVLIIAILILIPRRIMSMRVATWIAAAFAIVSAVTVIHNVQAYGSLVNLPHGPTYHSTAPSSRLISLPNDNAQQRTYAP